MVRSAKGKEIDMNALVAANHNVTAVGNMGINADGTAAKSNDAAGIVRGKMFFKGVSEQVANISLKDDITTDLDQFETALTEPKSKKKKVERIEDNGDITLGE